jgi:hypothetical protein
VISLAYQLMCDELNVNTVEDIVIKTKSRSSFTGSENDREAYIREQWAKLPEAKKVRYVRRAKSMIASNTSANLSDDDSLPRNRSRSSQKKSKDGDLAAAEQSKTLDSRTRRARKDSSSQYDHPNQATVSSKSATSTARKRFRVDEANHRTREEEEENILPSRVVLVADDKSMTSSDEEEEDESGLLANDQEPSSSSFDNMRRKRGRPRRAMPSSSNAPTVTEAYTTAAAPAAPVLAAQPSAYSTRGQALNNYFISLENADDESDMSTFLLSQNVEGKHTRVNPALYQVCETAILGLHAMPSPVSCEAMDAQDKVWDSTAADKPMALGTRYRSLYEAFLKQAHEVFRQQKYLHFRSKNDGLVINGMVILSKYDADDQMLELLHQW